MDITTRFLLKVICTLCLFVSIIFVCVNLTDAIIQNSSAIKEVNDVLIENTSYEVIDKNESAFGRTKYLTVVLKDTEDKRHVIELKKNTNFAKVAEIYNRFNELKVEDHILYNEDGAFTILKQIDDK